MSPKIAGMVIKDYLNRETPEASSAFSALTNRQREVLQLIAEGRNTKHIAFQLNISIKTVETHIQKLMQKLDIHSIAELTKYAIKEGLTSL